MSAANPFIELFKGFGINANKAVGAVADGARKGWQLLGIKDPTVTSGALFKAGSSKGIGVYADIAADVLKEKASAMAAVRNVLEKAGGGAADISKFTKEQIAGAQRGIADQVKAFTGSDITTIMRDKGFKFGKGGIGEGADIIRDIYSPNATPSFKEMVGNFYNPRLANGAIDTAARNTRIGATIGGGMLLGSTLLNSDSRGSAVGAGIGIGGAALAAGAIRRTTS